MKNFQYTVEEGVAVIVFDAADESVNTLSPALSSEFEALLTDAAAEPKAQAVLLLSAKKDNFIAGAKIDFLATLKTAAEVSKISVQGQNSLARLDAFAKPVIVGIDGACLGGGLELALACDFRIVTDNPKAQLGLPEVQLGLLPGAGGTQRLPQLIGVQAALDLILTGKSVKAQKALKFGLVDEVVPRPLLKMVALKRAQEIARGTLKPVRSRSVAHSLTQARTLSHVLKGLANKEAWAELALEQNPLGRRVLFEQARKQLQQKTKGKYPAPVRALEVIRIGLEKGMQAGLEAEAAAFGELAMSTESKRLIEIFFATTQLKKDSGVTDAAVKVKRVEKIGILGAGLMGAGIAYVASALQKVEVRLKDKDDESVGKGLAHVRGLFDERVKKRQLTWRERDQLFSLVSGTSDYSGFKNADVVIEAVFEDLALKHQMVREVESAGKADVIFASNTSSLPIAKIAEASAHPETVIGMHYFSPVNKMPLLEVIVHPQTADWVTATCVDIGKKQGKTVIVVKDGVGFYTSRILAPYMNEAAYLLAEGGAVEDIDKALTDFGFPVGPLTLLDEVGVDVAAKVAVIMSEAFGSRMTAPVTMKALLDDGRKGRKAKRGFYTYDGKKKQVDESVYEIMPHGKDTKRIDRYEMAERCVLQMVNEATRCLGEGIVRNPKDGDIGAIFGLGFPPFLGGPFRYAQAMGIGKLLERMEHYEERFGKRFEPAPHLVDTVKSQLKFYR